ncbi:hypothetical protein BY996DRAFT_6425417 [Phakopsora pachyrhizi]|nr:hypothetical protein BY996DRAFT_6428223 [Phakopsora pachyrhizi]KAI8444717.1 hypothetical protein BY996DRAFT_6425417 [Phakopsora pachyrhizi]
MSATALFLATKVKQVPRKLEYIVREYLRIDENGDEILPGNHAPDNSEASISRYNAVVGCSAPEYAVTLHRLSNLSTFHASYYHKVNRDVEAGAKAIYDTMSINKDITLEVGTRA